MSQPLSAREILRWFPQKWSEIAGNTKIIQTWWNMLVHGLCNVLFTGPSRSGKTRVMSLGIKAMLCTNRAADLNPCGQCPTCKALGVERYGHTGVFAALTGSIYNFKVIDCERVSREELLNLPLELDLDNPRTIIYLDEVAALGHSGLESLLLKPIDESRAIWLASAIKVRQTTNKVRQTTNKARQITNKEKVKPRTGLSLPMQGRFGIKVGTTLPSDAELTQWIKDRCDEWEIIIIEEEVSILLIIAITNRRVGYVIHILAAAATRGRIIDPDWLKEFNISPED